MKYEMIIQALENIHPGSFFRVGYKTEVPLKSSFSKKGYKITRISESTVRTGVSYKNIHSVIEDRQSRPEPVKHSVTHITPVLINKVYMNQETDQMYLRVYPTKKGTNKCSIYAVTTPDGFYFTDVVDDTMKEMIRESSLVEKFRPISMIKIENIYRIGSYYGSYE